MMTSTFETSHAETITFIKKHLNVDLNQYRDGDGSSPYTTAYWDKDGFKVAFDLKGMDREERNKLLHYAKKEASPLVIERGGSWFGYAYLTNQRCVAVI